MSKLERNGSSSGSSSSITVKSSPIPIERSNSASSTRSEGSLISPSNSLTYTTSPRSLSASEVKFTEITANAKNSPPKGKDHKRGLSLDIKDKDKKKSGIFSFFKREKDPDKKKKKEKTEGSRSSKNLKVSKKIGSSVSWSDQNSPGASNNSSTSSFHKSEEVGSPLSSNPTSPSVEKLAPPKIRSRASEPASRVGHLLILGAENPKSLRRVASTPQAHPTRKKAPGEILYDYEHDTKMLNDSLYAMNNNKRVIRPNGINTLPLRLGRRFSISLASELKDGIDKDTNNFLVFRSKKHNSLPRMKAAQKSLFAIDQWNLAEPLEWTESNKIMFHAFSFLLLPDLLVASRVCKSWNALSKYPPVWNNLFCYYQNKLRGNASDPNIWADPNLHAAHVSELNKLTLNQLVARLTPSANIVDQIDFGAFLMTYKTFTTPANLVRKLLERFHVPQKEGVNLEELEQWKRNTQRPIQLRVCNILKNLMDNYDEDLNEDIYTLLKIFIKSLDATDALARSLKYSFIDRKNSKNGTPDWGVFNSQKNLHPNQDVLEYPPEVLAEQLTIIEYELFTSVKAEEFIGNDKRKSVEFLGKESQMDKMVEHFNRVSRWVQETILKEEKTKARSKRMERFIKIAHKLKELRNFETMMAITSALGDIPIHRLSFTRAEVKPRHMKLLNEMNTLMSAEKSYSNYRHHLQSLKLGKPCIPYIGVYLRDMIYIEEGAKNGEKGTINFKSKKKMFGVLLEIQNFQRAPYQLSLDPMVSAKLRTLPDLPPKMGHEEYKKTVLYNLSITREPRNAVRSDLP